MYSLTVLGETAQLWAIARCDSPASYFNLRILLSCSWITSLGTSLPPASYFSRGKDALSLFDYPASSPTGVIIAKAVIGMHRNQ
jgi:hypothetical protein